MHYYALSLSSNIAPAESISNAFAHLQKIGLLYTAALYPFAAVDGVSPSYLNSAAVVACNLSREQLYLHTKHIEQLLGRSKGIKGHITIDIDIEAQAASPVLLAEALHNLQAPVYIHTPLLELAKHMGSNGALI